MQLILMLIELEQVMVQLKEGMEGNALKVTVMDRLVAELAGIETALVSLQDQVTFVFLRHCNSIINFVSLPHLKFEI